MRFFSILWLIIFLLGCKTSGSLTPVMSREYEPLYIASINYENQSELIFQSDKTLKKYQKKNQVDVPTSSLVSRKTKIKPNSSKTTAISNDITGQYLAFAQPRPGLFSQRKYRRRKVRYRHTTTAIPKNLILFNHASTYVSYYARRKIRFMKFKTQHITLHGYCDKIGPNDINYDLSKERAYNVAAIIKKYSPGIKITIVAHGEKSPAYLNRFIAGKKLNRSVLIKSN